MKQTYAIMGILGVFVLMLSAAGVYAYSNTNNTGRGMMGNYQGTYNGMMNGNINNKDIANNNTENYRGMMGNLDQATKDKMNAAHDEMIKNLDPETAKQMDAMHDACMGNAD
jgi:hypothetical protein